MESRREIFLIFKEALNNIVKYAKCDLVVFKLTRKGPELMLTIADNGVGFAVPQPGSTVRGNGLKTCRSVRATCMENYGGFGAGPGHELIHLWMPIA